MAASQPAIDDFATRDKAAAIFLGTPALIGTILIVLALFSPGSVPHRNRGTVIPIAIGLLTVGAGGGTIYVRWRLRRQSELDLAARARVGALDLQPRQCTTLMIKISVALAEEMLLQPRACQVPLTPGPLRASDISHSVFKAIDALQQRNAMLFDAKGVGEATEWLRTFEPAIPLSVNLGTPLNSLIPLRKRWRVWRALRARTGPALSRLAPPRWAVTLATVLGLAITFGITVPLAQWLDREHPIPHPNPVMHVIAKIIVRGGFFVLLIGSVAFFTILFRALFPQFSHACRTVGHVAAYVSPMSLREPDDRVAWTEQSVWMEVRRIIAEAMGVAPGQVQPHTLVDGAR